MSDRLHIMCYNEDRVILTKLYRIAELQLYSRFLMSRIHRH